MRCKDTEEKATNTERVGNNCHE